MENHISISSYRLDELLLGGQTATLDGSAAARTGERATHRGSGSARAAAAGRARVERGPQPEPLRGRGNEAQAAEPGRRPAELVQQPLRQRERGAGAEKIRTGLECRGGRENEWREEVCAAKQPLLTGNEWSFPFFGRRNIKEEAQIRSEFRTC